jgi:hypothetical protein
MAGQIPTRKPRKRNTNVRAISTALAGREQPYPTYRFSGKVFLERPGHNPFDGL